MNILTVSASPYLLVRNGRMNAAILQDLYKSGHLVATAAWHHDEGFFLPEETGEHWYELEDEHKVCKVYPIEPEMHGSAGLYEIMKTFHPDIVITIGDYKETDFVWEVKAMYPHLFKWIAVVCVDCLYINEQHKNLIEYADKVVSVNDFGSVAISGLCNVDLETLPFGPDHSVFYRNKCSSSYEEEMGIICSAKNAQASNIAAFISAMGQVNSVMQLEESENQIYGKLHTNLYDPGDYELELLIDRYGAENVFLPENFVSVKDSISDEELRDEYCSYDFVLDCSVKSATALSLLEAMSCGCVPIGPDAGMVGEVVRQMPKDYRFFVPHETYIGDSEEEFAVVSIEGLRDVILELRENIYNNFYKLEEAREYAVLVASNYSRDYFVDGISGIVEHIVNENNRIAVESF